MTKSSTTKRMPLIHPGDSTYHHDQPITPVSLSTMNVSGTIGYQSMTRFQDRPVICGVGRLG
jgi:hypothetical protein